MGPIWPIRRRQLWRAKQSIWVQLQGPAQLGHSGGSLHESGQPRLDSACLLYTSKNGINRCPFPLVRGKAGLLMKEMNNETIAKLQEKDDLERHRRSFGR